MLVYTRVSIFEKCARSTQKIRKSKTFNAHKYLSFRAASLSSNNDEADNDSSYLLCGLLYLVNVLFFINSIYRPEKIQILEASGKQQPIGMIMQIGEIEAHFVLASASERHIFTYKYVENSFQNQINRGIMFIK